MQRSRVAAQSAGGKVIIENRYATVGASRQDKLTGNLILKKVGWDAAELCSPGILSIDDPSNDELFPIASAETQQGWLARTAHGWYVRTLLWRCLHTDVFSEKAKTTSCEVKYRVHPRVAEFWCTVSSPVYLLPVVVAYQCGGLQALPPTALYALLSACGTAAAAFAYHALNTEFWSLVDLTLAFNTQLAFTLCFVEDRVNRDAAFRDAVGIHWSLNSHAWLQLGLSATVGLFALFLVSPVPRLTAVVVFAALFPPTCFVLWLGGCPSTVCCLAVATACFAVDRLRLFPAHSLWHILSAVCLYSTLASAMRLEA